MTNNDNYRLAWLTKGELKCGTEITLVDAQGHALNTNSVQKSIYPQVNSDKCGLCSTEVENASHLINASGMLTAERSPMGAMLKLFGICINTFKNERREMVPHLKPEKVIKSNQVKILWYFNI